MHRVTALLFVGVFGLLTNASMAQSLQPRLVGGSVEQSITDTCYVSRGFVTYERDFRAPPISGTKSVISFPELFVGGRRSNVGWDLSGQAVLVFATNRSGRINFINSNLDGTFSDYAESSFGEGGGAELSFLINMERGGCTLPINIKLQRSSN